MLLQKKKTNDKKSLDSNANLLQDRYDSRDGRKTAQMLAELVLNNDANEECVIDVGGSIEHTKKKKKKKGNNLVLSQNIPDNINVMSGATCSVELSKDNKQPSEDKTLKDRKKSRQKGSEEVKSSGSHFVEKFYSNGKGINEGVKEFRKFEKKQNKEKGKGNQKQITIPSQISSIVGETNVDGERKTEKKKKEINNESNNSTECAVNYNWENDKKDDSNRKRKGYYVEPEQVEDSSKQKVKKVSFSNEVEEFLPAQSSYEGMVPDTSMWGKRFTPDEDELIQKTVMKYVEDHQLGDQGLHMVLHAASYRRQVADCWKVIAAAFPWRSLNSVYARAHILFERSEERKWLPEELELLKRFHAEHGAKWKEFADIVGRNRIHVKDAWRRIKMSTQKIGKWSLDEYQRLFDLVNLDLRMKVFEEKKADYRVIRDNISWEAICSKLSTRRAEVCCMKWYNELVSSMVMEGHWTNLDDHKLIVALQGADSCCFEDVDWDGLLEHRSGDLCRKRWYQMIRHLHNFWMMSFVEQLEILSKRYCPEMIEYLQVKEAGRSDS